MVLTSSILSGNHNDADMISLVSEMEILKLIGTHSNVLHLLGCCTKDGALFMITEYAQYGNLQDFLRWNNPTVACEVTSCNLSQIVLLHFALEVAEGMEYLSSIKVCI